MSSAPPLDWSRIDTVLLDMDGTLLDLRFDNWFWQEHIPQEYARTHGISLQQAHAILTPKFRASMGTLNWYCVDFWSAQLAMDVVSLKRSVRENVQFLPGASRFLHKLAELGKRRVLVTNAHPRTLAIKNENLGLDRFLDAAYSTHAFGAPKEDASFWAKFHARERFDPERTLFVDDSVPVLDAASGFGIRELRAVARPDSGRGSKSTGRFIAIEGVAQLTEDPPSA